jgi:Mn2+/Fe2+ NRAMP family transporter
MINVIFESSLLIGGIFAIFMIGFYTLHFFNNHLTTDWDIFIITLGLVYSSIIIIHGWRLDPILLFSQILLTFICVSFCWILVRQRAIINLLTKSAIFD